MRDHLRIQFSLAVPPWYRRNEYQRKLRRKQTHRAMQQPHVRLSVVWQCKRVFGWGLKKQKSAPPLWLGKEFTFFYVHVKRFRSIFCTAREYVLSLCTSQLTSKVRRRRLAGACSVVKMTSSARYHDYVDKQPFMSSIGNYSPYSIEKLKIVFYKIVY